MSQNMQPGDLALTLVFDTEIPQGSQVELAERIGKGQMLIGKKGKMRAPTAGWYVAHPDARQHVAYGDAELMPLRNGPAPSGMGRVLVHLDRDQVSA